MICMDEIRSTIGKLTKTITKSSNSFVKVTKLSVSLANEEDALKSIYIDIGKKVQEIYDYGGTVSPYFDEKYNDIKKQAQKIQAMRDELDTAKGTRECPNCKRMVPNHCEFCPKCGQSMSGVPEAAPKAAPLDTAVSPPAVTIAKEMPAPQEIKSTTPQPAQAEVIQETPASAQIVPKVKTCPLCGAENGEDTRFCLSCGRSLS